MSTSYSALKKPDPSCPSCKERMTEGYLLDLGDGSRRRPQQWIEGPPQKSFWHGLEIKVEQRHTVVAFRCPRCGLLREYAL